MANHVKDGTTDYGALVYPKTDRRTVSVPSKQLAATQYNALCKSIDDHAAWLNGTITGDHYVGLKENAAIPASLPAAGGMYALTDGRVVAVSSAGVKHTLTGSFVNVLDYGAVADSIQATATITCITTANHVDSETFTLPGETATVYEIDKTGDGVTAGRIAVDISANTTAAQNANTIAVAINTCKANNKALCEAWVSASGVVSLRSGAVGTAGNASCSDTVANSGFVITNFTGGVIGTNNRTAFAAAIAAAQASGVGKVVVPAGVYLIQSGPAGQFAFAGNITLSGDGQHKTKILFGSTNADPNAIVNETTFCLMGNGSPANVTFEDMAIAGPIGGLAAASGGGNGLYIGPSCDNTLTIKRCSVRNFTCCVRGDNSTSGTRTVTILDSLLTAFGGACVFMDDGAVGSPLCNLIIDGCTLYTTDSAFTAAYKGHPIYAHRGVNFIVSNTKLLGTVYASGFNFTIYGGTRTPDFQTIDNVTFSGPAPVHLNTGQFKRDSLSSCKFDCTTTGNLLGVYLGLAGADFTDCTVVGGVTDTFLQNDLGIMPGPLVWRGGNFTGTFAAALFLRSEANGVQWTFENVKFNHTVGMVFVASNLIGNTNIALRNCHLTSAMTGVGANWAQCVGGTLAIQDCTIESIYPLYVNGGYGQIKLLWKNNVGGYYAIGVNRNVELDANNLSALITTSDGLGQVKFHSLALPLGVTNIRVRVVAQRTDVTTMAGCFEQIAAIRNDAGTCALIGASPTVVMAEADEGITCVVGVTTNNLTVTVTGVAAHTYDWKVKLDILGVC